MKLPIVREFFRSIKKYLALHFGLLSSTRRDTTDVVNIARPS